MANKKKNQSSGLGGILIIAGVLIAVMVVMWLFYNGGLGDTADKDPVGDDNQQAAGDVTPEPTPEPTPDTTPEPTPEVTPEATPEPTPEVEVTPENVDEVLDESGFDYNIDPSTLPNETLSWSFRLNEDHTPVEVYTTVDTDSYGAYHTINSPDKSIYLTFDLGYEAGYTESILDTLLENNVKATFFVTGGYITREPELVIRMKEEGHLVGNHTTKHLSSPDLSEEELIEEIQGTATLMAEETGYEMDLFFRPPMGEYSERTLYITRAQGYRTIFWGFAYADWDRENQPGKEAAYEKIMKHHYDGSILLLHGISESNTEALEDVIVDLKAEGYRFGQLYEVE